MASIRERIAQDIEATLKDLKIPGSNNLRVFRQQVTPTGRASYPAVVLTTEIESREQHASGDSRRSTITFLLKVYVQSAMGDTERNKILKLIEDTLDQDRTRGGLAIDSECVGTILAETAGDSDNTTRTSPRNYAVIEMPYEVEYLYQRGET